MGSYVSPTAAQITATGIGAPPYATILSYLQTQWQGIFGSDVYLGPDSQEGQFLGILSKAISDANSCAISAYQSFSPATAQYEALSNQVAINGMKRLVASYSTVTVTISGTAGTVIANGVLTDTAGGYRWDLPSSVTIGSNGTVTVTATCETAGAIQAAPNTVTQIAAGGALGWQSVTNPAAAAPGQPVELDGALRARQTTSVALPSLGVMDGIVGAILQIPGVTACAAYVNNSGVTDTNGLPAGNICFVVEGGSASAIAQAIAVKKTPGVPTYGTTTVNVPVAWSATPLAINFIVPAQVAITVNITLNPLNGYTSTIGAEIQAAVAAYINALGIGQNVRLSRLYAPACLVGPYAAPGSPNDLTTFEIASITLAANGGTAAAADVAIGFSSLATCSTANVNLTVT
jgi:uncharacterized phage protein gp47/JayE